MQLIPLTLLLVIPTALAREVITVDQIKRFYEVTLNPSSYDKRIRPNHGKEAVNVDVSMYVVSVHDYCPENHMIKVTAYFRQHWNDSRLTHSSSGPLVM